MFDCKRRNKLQKKEPFVAGYFDHDSSNYYNAPLTDAFINAPIKGADGREAVIHTSDIAMLFNQQRLDKMSSDAIIRAFEAMVKSNSALNAVRESMTDAQLVSNIKSRFIQSKSELLSYSYSLLHEVDRIKNMPKPDKPLDPTNE